MDNITIPFQIVSSSFCRTDNQKMAIDLFLKMLISTPLFSVPSDPMFGFVLNNMKFEIFDENEGVIYNSTPVEQEDLSSLYSKKLSGSSKNLNTFASDLKSSIERYEKRLVDVKVVLNYIRQRKVISISVTGNMVESGENYLFNTVVKAWN